MIRQVLIAGVLCVALPAAAQVADPPLSSSLPTERAPLQRTLPNDGRAAGPPRAKSGPAEIELVCISPGAELRVDGGAELTCPGRRVVRLEPGAHAIEASRPGFATQRQTIEVGPGDVRVIQVGLLSVHSDVRVEQRWPTWVPWSVLGAGAATAVLGGYLLARSSANFDAYDEQLEVLCADRGCLESEIPESTRDLESRARLQNQLGVGALIVGGAAVAVGAIMILINDPHVVDEPQTTSTAFVPVVDRDAFGVGVNGRF